MARHTFGPEELALLADIHAAPRGDTPRLVYADWLEDQGEGAYAGFVRLSCRARNPVSRRQPAFRWHARRLEDLAKATDPAERARLQELLGRWEAEMAARDLLLAHGRGWPRPLPPGLRLREYSRGLPLAAVAPAALEADPAELVRRMSPRLRLAVELAEGDLGRHLGGPLVGRADELLVRAVPGGSLGEGAVRQLASCPHLRTLEKLLLRPLRYDAMGASRDMLEPHVDVRATIAP
jgi:uncharacterized protein (TIGR02996 family)